MFPVRLVSSLMGAMSLAALAPAFAQEHRHDDGETGKPWSQADEIYGPEEMATARAALRHHHGGMTNWFVMLDRFETQFHDGETALVWDGQGWFGGDINKLWIKTEGHYSFDEDAFEEAEIQALWSRAVTAFFDVQAGVRYDLEPKGRAHGVIGVQGLAPYWFEIDAAAFISEDADVTASIEVEYELLFTQRLILQPRMEIELSAQDIPEIGAGAGVTHLAAGARLRYEIEREVAPYVGVEWQGAFGKTADYIRADGGDPKGVALVAGIRAWF